MKKIFLSHLAVIRLIAVAIMGIIAFFIDKENNWFHWSWIIYFGLLIFYLFIEYVDNHIKNMPPIEKVKCYLLDFENWKTNQDVSYYEPSPEFTIRVHNDESKLDYTQEWTRGEIGYHYDNGNYAYYDGIYYYETCLKKIHIVTFDGGKKTIVAPDWTPIDGGRIYFYVNESTEYAYQKYLTKMYANDFSKNLRKSINNGGDIFSIPVFDSQNDKQKFLNQFNNTSGAVITDKDEQNRLFYVLVERYTEYKKVSKSGSA